MFKRIGQCIKQIVHIDFANGAKNISMKKVSALKGSFIYYVRKNFWKTNIPYPLFRTRLCAYQGVRNVSFSENSANVIN